VIRLKYSEQLQRNRACSPTASPVQPASKLISVMNVSGDAVSSTNDSITSATGLDREVTTHAYDAAVGTFA